MRPHARQRMSCDPHHLSDRFRLEHMVFITTQVLHITPGDNLEHRPNSIFLKSTVLGTPKFVSLESARRDLSIDVRARLTVQALPSQVSSLKNKNHRM